MRTKLSIVTICFLVLFINPVAGDEKADAARRASEALRKAIVKQIVDKLKKGGVKVAKGEPSMEELARRVGRLPSRLQTLVLTIPKASLPSKRADPLSKLRKAGFRSLVIKQLKKDATFPEKLAKAMQKAKAKWVELHPHPQRGRIHYYFALEKRYVNSECGITWWMTQAELNPHVIFD